jgi:hypothetical protein
LPDTESLNKMFAKLLVRVITTRAKLVHWKQMCCKKKTGFQLNVSFQKNCIAFL